MESAMNIPTHRVLKSAVVVIACLLFAMLATDSAFARGGSGGGKGGGARSSGHGSSQSGSHGGGSRSGSSGSSHSGHGHGSHSHYGVFVGGPIYWGGYSYPPAYYYPGFASPPPELGYIQQGDDLYYCSDAAKHYPEVTECPGGWVLITPPPAPPS
jgi:hypothetical protein